MTVRFNDAFEAAQHIALELAALVSRPVALVQDVVGRFRFVVDDRGTDVDRVAAGIQMVFKARRLGGFDPGPDRLLWASDLYRPEDLFGIDALALDGGASSPAVYVDRAASGADWRRPALPNAEPRPKRLVTYGVKGGVGRSTATAVLAWRLARAGRRVLAIDLDIESPGLGSLLVPADRQPEAGVVDWFVEDAVGQADDELLADMISEAVFAPPFEVDGVVLVVSAAGRPDVTAREQREGDAPIPPSYLDKLTRARLDLAHDDQEPTFAGRLARMLDALEAYCKPDYVLIDARSGLHDLAAIALTRLGAECFLFAGGSPSTWSGYHLLLHRWATRLDAAAQAELLSRLHIVAALMPERGRPAYSSAFEADAYETFRRTLYPAALPNEPAEYVQSQTNAPHSPVIVLWTSALIDLSFTRIQATVSEVEAAFEHFLRVALEALEVDESKGSRAEPS